MKQKGKQMLRQNLEEFPHLNKINGAKKTQEADESQHPLLSKISDSTKFLIVRLPNQDCLNFGVAHR